MQILLFYFKDDELWSIFVVANCLGVLFKSVSEKIWNFLFIFL